MNPLHPAILPDTPMRPHASTVTLPCWALAVQLVIIVIAVSVALASVLLASNVHAPNPSPRPSTGPNRGYHLESHPRFQLIQT